MTRLLDSVNACETALPHHHFQYHALPGFPNTETISRSIFRLSYLVGERVRKNWARSNYKEGLVHHLTEEARVGGSTEHLVLLENTRLRAWRTDQPWIQLITSRHQTYLTRSVNFLFLDLTIGAQACANTSRQPSANRLSDPCF